MTEKDGHAINNLKKMESQINIKDFKKRNTARYIEMYYTTAKGQFIKKI